MSKIKIGAQVTAKVCPTKVTVSGTFQGYELQDREDPTSVCGKVFYVKDGMQRLDFVYVDSIKVDSDGEDERIRKYIVSFVELNKGVNLPPDDADNMLAYLERIKEQKHEEWSEEDEKMLTGIIERGSSQIPSHEPALREEQMEWLMKRLRLLRPQPHWKPSEDQMKALNEVANNGVLLDLFNDLLKLL